MWRFSIVFLSFVFIASLLFLGITISYRDVSFDSHKLLSYASLLLFIGISFVAIKNDKYYIFFLPFVLIALPSPVNDLFPGVLSGPRDETGSAVYPFFTHIDVFILIGIVRKYYLNGIKIPFKSRFLYVLLAAMFLSLIINLIRTDSNKDFLLLIAGSFQIRFIVGFYILVSEYDFTKHSNSIYLGILFSILFLFVESILNTAIKGGDRLSSGTLGMNTFGNLIAALFMFLLFYKDSRNDLNKYIHFSAMALCIIIILMTKNRMSILALFMSYIFIKVFIFGSLRLFVKYLFIGTVLLFIFWSFFLKYIPDRFNPSYLINKIEFKSFSFNPEEVLSVEGSLETSSVITRLQLFSTSYNMILAHPIVGIGSGKWNNEKLSYGYSQNVLLDSHNGYLSILSQYGLLGVFLIYFVYFLPFFRIRKFKGVYPPVILLFGLVNVVFIIADISNSGVYKFQVFSFLCFISIICLSHGKLNKIEAKKSS